VTGEKVLIARAEKRPYALDYVTALTQDFLELQGDRKRLSPITPLLVDQHCSKVEPVMIVGHQKGRNIHERQFRNFAMAKPGRLPKRRFRLFEMAERLIMMPVISFVDTPAG